VFLDFCGASRGGTDRQDDQMNGDEDDGSKWVLTGKLIMELTDVFQ